MEIINGIDINTGATAASLSDIAANVIGITGYATEASLSEGLAGIIGITGYSTEASVSEVASSAISIKTTTDKLAGSIAASATTASWNTSEANIVSIGANDTKYKLHSLVVDMNALHVGATITLRMYSQINGTERKLYDEDYVVGTDPDGVWLVDGTVGIHEVLRVSAESNAATDDGASIPYDYILEEM